MQPDHLPMLDLLWKYYEKSKNYSAAARILAKLADKHGYVGGSNRSICIM